MFYRKLSLIAEIQGINVHTQHYPACFLIHSRLPKSKQLYLAIHKTIFSAYLKKDIVYSLGFFEIRKVGRYILKDFRLLRVERPDSTKLRHLNLTHVWTAD